MTIHQFVSLTIILFSALVLVGCSSQAAQEEDSFVAVGTFFPLEDLTRQVVAGAGTSDTLVPPRMDPHSFEPSPRDIIKLEEATAFVTLGVGLEPFERRLARNLDQEKVVRVGDRLELLDVGYDGVQEQSSNNLTGKDPHVWLSPKNALVIVSEIEDGLSRIAPAHAQEFSENAQVLREELRALEEEFSQGLAACDRDVILVAHNAYSYLARDYGFEAVAVAGLAPESEPDPRRLQAVVDIARELDLKHVFYEPYSSTRIPETIASEIDGELLKLNPLEIDTGSSYQVQMRENLANLRVALGCE